MNQKPLEQRETEIKYTDVAAKVRALKEAGVEPSGDDPRAKEVWDLIDAYAEQTGAWTAQDAAQAREQLATIWTDNGWADDAYFRDKAIEDLAGDLADAEAAGNHDLAKRLQEKLDALA